MCAALRCGANLSSDRVALMWFLPWHLALAYVAGSALRRSPVAAPSDPLDRTLDQLRRGSLLRRWCFAGAPAPCGMRFWLSVMAGVLIGSSSSSNLSTATEHFFWLKRSSSGWPIQPLPRAASTRNPHGSSKPCDGRSRCGERAPGHDRQPGHRESLKKRKSSARSSKR